MPSHIDVQTTQEVFPVEVTGVVTEIKAPKTGGTNNRRWTRRDFVVKQTTGQIANCNTFGALQVELGDAVKFEANYNPKFYTYQVVGNVEVLASEVEQSNGSDEPLTENPKKPLILAHKGRPKKNIFSSPVVKERTASSDLESVREEVEEIVKADVKFAVGLFNEYFNNSSAEAVATLVQAFQAVRATTFIEANKRERVANMTRR